MKQKKHDSMVFHKAWWESIKIMPLTARTEIYDNICKYVFDGIEPNLDPMSAVSMAISFIRRDIDNDKARYAEICAKRAEAGRKHTGNQYTYGTNGTSVPKMEQNGTNGTDNDNDNDNDVKDRKRKNEKDKSFSFSQKKEKIIFDFSLLLLSEGRPNAYAEARDAYEYNDATNWESETKQPNGNVVKKKITNKLSWLRGWKRTNEQIFPPSDGALFAKVFDGLEGINPENECIINHFRGIREDGENGIVMLFSNYASRNRFCYLFESNSDFKSRVCAAMRIRYPKAEMINYKIV